MRQAFKAKLNSLKMYTGDWGDMAQRKQPTSVDKMRADKIRFTKALSELREPPKAETGWSVKGKLLGGIEPQKRKQTDERTSPGKKRRTEPRQEIRISYQNVNGLDQLRKQEIEEYMEDYR